MSTVRASTRVAAVIGSPVRHSLSPVIHNAAFRHLGLDWVYAAFEVPPGQAADAIAAMRVLGLGGVSVTMPHKEAVAACVDRLSPQAARLRSVNTVRWEDGELVGESTDGEGLVASLRHDAGLDPAGRTFVVLGAGGAARAVALALGEAGAATVTVVNRTPARAEEAAALAGDSGRVGVPADVGGAEVVVNATPIGMEGVAPAALPFDPDLVRPGQVVVDLVYQPLLTPILLAARERGAVAVTGLGMLVHQAAAAFRLWTGAEAPVPVMAAAAGAALRPGTDAPLMEC